MKSTCQVGSASSGRLLLAVLLILPACGPRPAATSEPAEVARPASTVSNVTTRAPAVAGLFYPKEPERLAATVDRYLAAALTNRLGEIRALIVPHAGYEYSGPVAACAYAQIAGRDYRTVVILAASHYAAFRGASVPATDAYETPLGRVPVSGQARALAKSRPFVLEPRGHVQRPQWVGIASKPAPAAGEDTPETWEHSVEVQIPFLQRALKDFTILPVMFGDADPFEVAKALSPLLDGKTLVIASTDLSHYHPYAEACARDRKTVQAICDLATDLLAGEAAEQAACGRVPVLSLLHLAKLKGWRPHLLNYRNSGDTAGDKRAVVGYAAVAFTGPVETNHSSSAAAPAGNAPQCGRQEREFLLELARRTLRNVTSGRGLPETKSDTVPVGCRRATGCFVTLTKQGELRGCIGNILPDGPLYQAVMQNARRAALEDPRFRPVAADEAGSLRIEISVLSVPEPLAFSSPEDLLARLQPHRDGVVLQIGNHSSTFLPQVWEQIPDKLEFLAHLAVKGGSPPSAWRRSEVRVSTYRVEAFAEPQ